MPKSNIKTESIARNYLNLKCFPNPTNGLTTISFNLPEPSNVTLNIYDTFGNKILSDLYPTFNAGQNSLEFDLSPYATGYYSYTLETASGISTGKVINIK